MGISVTDTLCLKCKLGVEGVFLERTKYRIRVGRGLAPAAGFAVNSETGTDRSLRSNCIFIFQSERSRPFPTIFHYSFFIIHPFSGRRGRRPLRTKWNAFAPRTPIFPCVSAPASVYQTELRANSLLQQAAFPCIIKDRLSLQTGGLLVSCVVRSRTTDAG